MAARRFPRSARRVAAAAVVLLTALGGCASGQAGTATDGPETGGPETGRTAIAVISPEEPAPGASAPVVYPVPTSPRFTESSPRTSTLPVTPAPSTRMSTGTWTATTTTTAAATTTTTAATTTAATTTTTAATTTAATTTAETQPTTRSAPPSPQSTRPAPPPRTSTAGAPASFRASIGHIDDALAHRMRTSYHAGCPVPLRDLRYLQLSYWGFDGAPHTGELVVSARVARDVVTAFRSLYAHRFPIRQMRLVDDFGGSDDASMAADNTSAFNCRPVTGGTGWSEHSFGEAIDINPVQNPYLSGSTVLPPAGRAYLDRPDEPGVIHAGGPVVRAFAAIGWTWGGTWSSPVDLQHFSRSGH